MARGHGYPVWHKFIDTVDGYIIDLFRIPGKRHESLVDALSNVKNREPVLLSHGVGSSCDGFIMNGPVISPAY
jgi:hypothetical protein